jgi:hypothetical protein
MTTPVRQVSDSVENSRKSVRTVFWTAHSDLHLMILKKKNDKLEHLSQVFLTKYLQKCICTLVLSLWLSVIMTNVVMLNVVAQVELFTQPVHRHLSYIDSVLL